MLRMNFSGFWDIFAYPFGYVMQGLNYVCRGNYVLSLLLFALVVKLVTLPMAIKQQKNSIKGAALRPKMMLIEKKYAGRTDQKTLRKKQEELMELQQREGYSPFSGCLPMLIQFPIIIALYRIIRFPLKYICNLSNEVISNLHKVHYGEAAAYDAIGTARQIEMINRLNQTGEAPEGIVRFLPDFNLFGHLNLGLTPSFKVGDDRVNLWLLLIPVLCCALSYLSMWIGRKLNDNGMAQLQSQTPEQKSSMTIMNLVMPLMSLWIAFITPAAVGLYWIYTSLFGVLQTVLLAKLMPLPTYTEEEIREIQRAMKNQKGQPRTVVGTSVDENGKPKSLHYEDDDDEY